jgi:hypothetical protein
MDLTYILQAKIMDRFLLSKWDGRLEVQNSILDFSSPFMMMKDHYGLFKRNPSDEMIVQL